MKREEKDIMMSDLLYKSLHDELSKDERTMLNCWLENKENREFYQEMKNPESLFDGIQEMAELDQTFYYRKVQRRLHHKHTLRLWYSATAIAAITLLVLWVKVLLQEQKSDIPFYIVAQEVTDRTTLKTGTGKIYLIDDSIRQIEPSDIRTVHEPIGLAEKQQVSETMEIRYNVLTTSSRGAIEVTLSDSSRVWLNAGSQLRYPNEFTTGERIVELIGEAYFEVTHFEHKPFIVKSGETEIEVLGTKFNVNTGGGRCCTTTLVQGCVKVRNGKKDSVIIYPGQQVEALQRGMLSVRAVDTRFFTAWQRDRFAFQDAPLWKIMEELAEWYGFTYEFTSATVVNLCFTTIVPRYEKVSDVLSILQSTHGFSYTQDKDGVIRLCEFSLQE